MVVVMGERVVVCGRVVVVRVVVVGGFVVVVDARVVGRVVVMATRVVVTGARVVVFVRVVAGREVVVDACGGVDVVRVVCWATWVVAAVVASVMCVSGSVGQLISGQPVEASSVDDSTIVVVSSLVVDSSIGEASRFLGTTKTENKTTATSAAMPTINFFFVLIGLSPAAAVRAFAATQGP